MVAVGTPVDETLKDKLVTGTVAAIRLVSTGRNVETYMKRKKQLYLHVHM